MKAVKLTSILKAQICAKESDFPTLFLMSKSRQLSNLGQVVDEIFVLHTWFPCSVHLSLFCLCRSPLMCRFSQKPAGFKGTAYFQQEDKMESWDKQRTYVTLTPMPQTQYLHPFFSRCFHGSISVHT